MRLRLRVFVFESDMHPLTVPQPNPRRIGENRIGDEGATALAAILKETMITHLKCAAAPECLLLCVSAP